MSFYIEPNLAGWLSGMVVGLYFVHRVPWDKVFQPREKEQKER